MQGLVTCPIHGPGELVMEDLEKATIVEELGDEEITKTGEFDDKSKGVYSVVKSRGV